MLEWYLTLSGTEIANHARLSRYLETVGSPLTEASPCGCETFDAALVGDEPYTTPEEDAAPWWDPDVPESADFAGLLVLDVKGIDDSPVSRSVSAAVTGGAALGPANVGARTLTVSGVLLGSSCCGVEYGLRWLGRALEGCTGPGCGGDCLSLFNCCPSGEAADPEEFAARHRRTLRRVALVSGPTVTARHGGGGCSGSGGCSVGADMLQVEFVLTAGTPWAWTDPVRVLDVEVPTDDGSECVVWCVHPKDEPLAPEPVCLELTDAACAPGTVRVEAAEGDGSEVDCSVVWLDDSLTERPCATCRLAECPDERDVCGDPSCTTPAPPVPPPPETCFRRALAVNSQAYELDLSDWPRWFGSVPMIEVHAGSRELRRVTVSFFERSSTHEGMTCAQVAEEERCRPHSVFEIGYVPAGGVLTLDGQVGRATVECAGAYGTSTDAYGRDGLPLAFPLLDCARYCVLVEADAIVTPAADASLSISLSGREY
ncbi:hypothetical protein [Streptomyces sp. SPB074]|uniref:hypothetical protein n=1 Tax=Streptomyces sp. (strain SPB074) TaxID=465543 RepID=UPI00017F124A|nr:hypothetical protein [Streptomyces sp. SPB074]